MLKAKDFRDGAWASLSGKWGICALTTLVYVLIMGVVTALSSIYVGYVLEILLAGALTLGYSIVALTVVNGGAVNVGILFSGFNQYGKSLVLWLTNNIFYFFVVAFINCSRYNKSFILFDELLYYG